MYQKGVSWLNKFFVMDVFVSEGLGKKDVYVYIHLKYVKEMLRDGNWVLRHTKKWEDVYENFYSKYKKSQKRVEEIESKLFGQSWTMFKKVYEAAMWSIYSNRPNKDPKNLENLDETAVRIKTTVLKLKKAIDSVSLQNVTAYIGDVEYKNGDELKNWICNPIPKKWIGNHPIKNDAIIDSFFIKRDAFKHEKEARIIIYTDYSYDKEENLQLNINPFDFIEGYTLDPRLSPEQCNSIKNELNQIAKNKGNGCLKIEKSPLYDE